MAEPRKHPTDDMPFEESMIWLLKSIDVSMKDLVNAANRRAKQATAAAGGDVADDRELDSKFGDRVVKSLPSRWTGSQSFKGKKMSECPPDLLDMLASRFDFFAAKNDKEGAKADNGEPKSTYDRKDAARARGWAKRIRAGWKPTAATASRSDAAERYRQQVEEDGDEPL